MIQLGANLLSSVATSDTEVSQSLVSGAAVRLERIVSFGRASPEGFWYDQPESEWVTVLTGRARIRVADHANDIMLGPGDTVLLPAHCLHRVEWTDPDQPTIWLALFVDGELRPA